MIPAGAARPRRQYNPGKTESHEFDGHKPSTTVGRTDYIARQKHSSDGKSNTTFLINEPTADSSFVSDCCQASRSVSVAVLSGCPDSVGSQVGLVAVRRQQVPSDPA